MDGGGDRDSMPPCCWASSRVSYTHIDTHTESESFMDSDSDTAKQTYRKKSQKRCTHRKTDKTLFRSKQEKQLDVL